MWQQKSAIPQSPALSSARLSTPTSWELVEGSGGGRLPASKDSTPSTNTPIRIGSPAIFGQEDRKAGAAGEGDKIDEIASIQSQTVEIASLVKIA